MSILRGRFLPAATACVATIVLANFASATAQNRRPANSKDKREKSPVVLKSTTRLVELDVVVTDAAGKPISELRSVDFAVLEDGKPQQIAVFETPQQHWGSEETTLTPVAPERGIITPHVAARPQTIFVLDELNTTFADASFARQELLKFLRTQAPELEQPTAIVMLTTRGLIRVSELTRDRTALVKTLESERAELPSYLLATGGLLGGVERLMTSLRALIEIALANGNREGRKNLIWIGNGLPILSTYGVSFSNRDRFTHYVQYAANWLQESRTTVYTVDPHGVAVWPEGATVDPANVAHSPTAGLPLLDVPQGDLIFEKIAPETGGKIFRKRNDVNVEIGNAVQDGRNYYTLAYYPTNNKWDGSFRTIHVVLNGRTNLTARTQAGYYAFEEGFALQDEQINFALSHAVTSPLELQGVRFDTEGKVLAAQPPTARFTLKIDSDGLSWETEANGDRLSKIMLVAVSVSSKNMVLNYLVTEATIHVRKEKFDNLPNGQVNLDFNIHQPKKTDRWRLVIRDAGSGRLGASDFSNQKLTQVN